MRTLLVLLLWVLPFTVGAQTSEVRPGELELGVAVDEGDVSPVVGEMVLITIRGIYRRHITLESLVQPDLEGFSWAQLGPDAWSEERIDGKKVKIFTRRMALYPNTSGTLEIGSFRHDLTLTDEGDDWFEHPIASEPLKLEVAEAPAGEGWWFPVRRLEISDQWSNAPDQLKTGEGVLRVIRLEALGVTPEMIPPMPELISPSAMIFPHPEKRLVELTPEGPVTYAFWRWTVRPTNTVSAIVEPLTVSFFDTTHRVAREVTISAQRVAYGDVAPKVGETPNASRLVTNLPGGLGLGAGGLVFLLLLGDGLKQRKFGLDRIRRWSPVDSLHRGIKREARLGDAKAVRRLAGRLIQRDGTNVTRTAAISELDGAVFSRNFRALNLSALVKDLLRSR